MATDLIYPHIHQPPGGSPHIERIPRIRVANVAMDYLAHGWSAEEMCRQHPYLTLAEIHAALTFYFDHQAEIDQEIQLEWESAVQDRSQAQRSPFFVRMHAQGRL